MPLVHTSELIAGISDFYEIDEAQAYEALEEMIAATSDMDEVPEPATL
jgi:hypothetical protein